MPLPNLWRQSLTRRRSAVAVGTPARVSPFFGPHVLRVLDSRLLKSVPVEGWDKPYNLNVRFGRDLPDLCNDLGVENQIPRNTMELRKDREFVPQLVDYYLFEPVNSVMLATDSTVREKLALIGWRTLRTNPLVYATQILPPALLEADDCLVVGMGSAFHYSESGYGYPCLERVNGRWILRLTKLVAGSILQRRHLFLCWRKPDSPFSSTL